ncbi:MAG: SH3 domain-containing protein [Pseudomonadota bacterium]|nr:SH3 domain-containing protein [Pseudomonadota bacterium]
MLPLLLVSFAAAADWHHLGHYEELPPGVAVYTAATLVNLRGDFATDAPVVRRLPVGTRLTVVEQVGERVEVRMGAIRGWVARELLSTMGRDADLDGDGIPERIVVALDAQGNNVAWLREAGHVQQLTLYPEDGTYLGDWALVSADEAGVPLLRVALSRESCGAEPTSWLSYQDGVLREAIGVLEWADGAMGVSAEVTFGAPGQATVHQEDRDEDGDVVAIRERTCTLAGGAYSCT